MNALRPYTMYWVEWMHYVPIARLGYNESTASKYNVKGRMYALRPYTMFRVEWMHYVPIQCSVKNKCTTSL